MGVGDHLMKFALWFLLELGGTWGIWATYMAVKFIVEVGQGQRASFSLSGSSGSAGALIIFPVIATAVWTIEAAFIAADAKVKE